MKLEEFLVRAKMNTYASVGENSERDLEDGSKELMYEEGEWKYRDRYFGSNRFAGQEIVWRNKTVIWAMNYCGGMTTDRVAAKEVYDFLKKALGQVRKDLPFRGPQELIEGDYAYYHESEGMIDCFDGSERILYQRERVYKLNYHGGVVKK